MKLSRILCLVLLALAAPALMHAQGGCTDSPENPTVVLSLVGAAGAVLSTWRARRK